MISLAKKAGACHCIKFQAFSLKKLLTKHAKVLNIKKQ